MPRHQDFDEGARPVSNPVISRVIAESIRSFHRVTEFTGSAHVNAVVWHEVGLQG
ncbi:MAG: hypothetical protein LBJ59_10445 [Zoogloeaceae bacterium]|nr:hypothetical protein [Zoogloeaceae bacterium]